MKTAVLMALTGLLAALPTTVFAAPGCGFVLGFATLASQVPVGDCLESQAFAANGDALQHTTKGLLVWRKADNWTAFTDGFRTWINFGGTVGARLNTERDPREADYWAYAVKIDAAFGQAKEAQIRAAIAQIPLITPSVVDMNYLDQDFINAFNVKYPGKMELINNKLGSRRFMDHFDSIDSIVQGPTEYCISPSQDTIYNSCWAVLSNGRGRIVLNPSFFDWPMEYQREVIIKELVGVIGFLSINNKDIAEEFSFGTKMYNAKINIPPSTASNIKFLRDTAVYTLGEEKYVAYLDRLVKAS